MTINRQPEAPATRACPALAGASLLGRGTMTTPAEQGIREAQRQATHGYLADAQDQVILENCTLEDAMSWLRAYNAGRGWRGGQTAWLPDDAEPATLIEDVDSDFRVTLPGAE